MGIRIAHLGDFHLGHAKTKAITTADSLRKYLFPLLPELDLVLIAGDVCDNTVTFGSDDARVIISFFFDLFSLADIHGVTIRILRGTIFHDRTQLNTIEPLIGRLCNSTSVKIMNNPQVEYIKKFDKYFLYLPDDLPYKNKHMLFKHVDKLLLSTPDNKVDYVVCHGTFDFSCFGYTLNDAYTIDDFKDICKEEVFTGHVHTPQRSGNVTYSGSFDRLAHGEEGRKGFWVINGTHKFIQNHEAVLYKTFTYKSDTLEALLLEHDKRVSSTFSTDTYHYLRVIIDDVLMRQALRLYHLKKYPHITITFKKTKSAKVSENEIIQRSEETLEPPTEANIVKLIYSNVKANHAKLNIDRIREEIFDGV